MKKTFISTIVLSLLLSNFLFEGFSKYQDKPISKAAFTEIFTKKDDPWVENIISKMTLEEKAGQVVFPHAYGRYMSADSPDYQRLVKLVKERKVGGLIFFLSNIYDQAILTNKMQELADVPLLISADFERGVAQRAVDATLFPYNMGIGAADDAELTYQMGKIIAEEGRALGVHQNYAPVADVNNNPFNPIINVRSFGEDVSLVQRLSNAFLKGIQEGGMLATSKHFPGHGNTDTDSHRSLPTISGSKQDLWKTELAPFKSNIENGVMSFMIGHLDVPAFEQKSGLPSTLSKSIVTELLQYEMRFKGLIVTDAMGMRAITNSFTTAEATVLALKAGNDAILFPNNPEESIGAIIEAVKKGELTEERLDHSIRKILLAKKWAGLDKNKFIDLNDIANKVGTNSHWETAKKLARKSITLVKNDDSIIPLTSDSKRNFLNISLLDSRIPGAERYFNSLLSQRLTKFNSRTLLINGTDEDYKAALEAAKNSDVIFLSVYLKVRAYEGNLGLTDRQAQLVNDLLKLNKTVVFTSHGNPYILSLFPDASTYLCNYGDTEVSEQALAEAIFGEIDIRGNLPVSIPNSSYAFGSGIKLNQSALRNEYFPLPGDRNKFKEADNLVEHAISDTAFPGAVLLIAKDGKVIYEKAYGKYTYDYTSKRMSTNTIFDLASLSKVIATTTAAMICYDRKLIDLDDKVAKHIPEFGQNEKENITIRNLLVHNSGLVAWKKFYEHYNNPEDVLKDIYASPLEYPTGTKMVYSDLGMITLAKIIEKVTGKTLDVFCKDEIFDTLGMSNTMYNPPASLKDRIAPTEFDNYWRMRQLVGEVHDEAASLLNGVAGHAGLFSTASDLSKILQMLMRKGNYQGKQFIKPETIELFTKKQSDQSSRALGWDTKSPEGSSAGNLFSNLSYGHTGYTGTSVWNDPTRNLFVVFLTNRVYPTRNNTKLLRLRPILHDAVIKAIENN
jgi:beta-glucosidase-like glycosyl hydrolase/CubicO group peptidase (beta-lactamase class C family)